MNSQNRIEKKSTQVRQGEIIQAALEVIGKEGVTGLTISGVAQAAQMSEANIYRHFRNKLDMIRGVAEFIGDLVVTRAARMAASSGSPLDKLEEALMAQIGMIARNPGIPRLLFSDGGIASGGRIARIMSGRIELFQATLTGLLEAAKDEGELREQVQPRETAITIMGMMQFSVLRWISNQAEGDLVQELKLLWGNLRRLISA